MLTHPQTQAPSLPLTPLATNSVSTPEAQASHTPTQLLELVLSATLFRTAAVSTQMVFTPVLGEMAKAN